MTETRVGEWLVDEAAPSGSGQFARVLPARRVRPDMDGHVEHRAVKIYYVRGDAEQRRRALDEIRVQERLMGRPHAVAHVDAFLAGEGPYAGCLVQVMELGDRSLGDHLDAAGPLPSHEAVAALAGVAEALEHVHARGLAHADLKPGDIVRCRGLWKIADFDVATALRETAAQDLGGTPSSMSPQRLAPPGAGRREVRPADDLWALGMVLGQCLLGGLPSRVTEPRAEEALRLAREVVDALTASGAEPRATALAGELLSTDPARRPTAREAARRLRGLATTEPLASTLLIPYAALAAASYGDPHLEVFAADSRGLCRGWNAGPGWSGWHGMDGPAPARALAAGSPETYRQHLWLLDRDGRLWQRSPAVDPKTCEPAEDWSAWESVPTPGTAPATDIAAAGAPWTAHRLYAVDRDGTGWHRDDLGGGEWATWAPLPGAPADLVSVRAAVACGGLAAVDGTGAVWRSPGSAAGRRRRVPDGGHGPVLGVVPLPDGALVVLTGDRCVLHPGGLSSGPFPEPPPGRYTRLGCTRAGTDTSNSSSVTTRGASCTPGPRVTPRGADSGIPGGGTCGTPRRPPSGDPGRAGLPRQGRPMSPGATAGRTSGTCGAGGGPRRRPGPGP
ncbi:protein kinase [Streptomyces sp. NPDC058664]|uniref:protein kinase domain-containing protein n=1 Tax=unclassified Streptomyces TaxID=2593676 RepID=UPI003663F55C